MRESIRIGGQAVINGVMMRTKKFVATSIRKNDGSIKTRSRKFTSITEKNKVLGLPFIRGFIALFEMMILGMKELTWSSNESADSEDEKLSKKEIAITIILSIILALALFKLLPWFLANTLGFLAGESSFYLNALDALLKTVILILYIYAISLMPDVRVLFQYHGAEHKSVSCYESGKKLTPKNAQKFPLLHPRCGTTFIIIVFFLSIFVYMLIPSDIGFWQNYAFRIALLPVIAGISFEVITLGGKYYRKSLLVRILIWPGMQFQRLTTRQPTDDHVRVAIKSLQACIEQERKAKS